ncbi:iron ABC transporter substrate-binding protein [Nocardioides marmoribigeumensis]|uniref:Iron(III) transport system substrate-binding protein n=1 Tax=Nocardioides marmoribigeumensis TaxID=433649 RepID=A0ABU2BQC6_9ACTN|nr:iron ABC transporter substrate-binding protein [Nocardioides marmoribigeumensis]MDR7360461.1 iron(III) transport system substrate-binding protein [Nocardioides marmoribigeumensis]
MRRRSALIGLVAAVLCSPALAACGGGDDADLVIYNAQHEELISVVAKKFEEKTGLKVELRNSDDLGLANQLVAEGKASPADVFLTENSPAMSLVQSKGLLTKLDQKTLDNIPAQYRPSDGTWTGFAARSTVLVYNTDQVKPADLPTSLMDLAEPEWKGKVAFSPTGADFQAIVSAVLHLEGEARTKQWLAGLKANGEVYDGNNVVLQSVNEGDVETGIIYHYYWYRDQEESGENSDHSRLHFFGHQDPGAFVSVSGAGVLKGSDHQADAQRFVNYLTSKEGQQVIADSYALEYTLNPQVDLGRGVKGLADLDPPEVDVSDLNGPEVVKLMEGAGFL